MSQIMSGFRREKEKAAPATPRIVPPGAARPPPPAPPPSYATGETTAGAAGSHTSCSWKKLSCQSGPDGKDGKSDDSIIKNVNALMWHGDVIRVPASLDRHQGIRKLKNELLEIRKKGAKIHRLRQNTAKICVRCQKALGLIFERGDICQSCQFRVCKACRVVVKDKVWKCTVCAKIAQITIATGDWFFEEKSRRFKNATVLGTEIVRKSIMRRLSGSKRVSVFSISAKIGEDTRKFSTDIKENTIVPISEESESSGKRQHPGKGEDGKSIRSKYDTQSIRSTRSLPRANGPDRRFGRQTRSGEDAISIHSNLDTQSLRSISSIPRSERRSRPDVHSLPEASQAEFLHNGQESVDVISQASFKIDSRSESKRSSPVSVRESVHSLDPTGSVNSQTTGQSNSSWTTTSAVVHCSSPTPSKRSLTSNYSHTQSLGSGMKTSSSIPEDIAKRHRRRGSGTPSLALSRVSVASGIKQAGEGEPRSSGRSRLTENIILTILVPSLRLRPCISVVLAPAVLPVLSGHVVPLIKALGLLYGEPNSVDQAEKILLALCQGQEAAELYCQKCRKWSVLTKWNEDALAAIFRKGLSESVKDVMMGFPTPAGLSDSMSLAIQIDRRLRERRVVHTVALSSEWSPEPMQVLHNDWFELEADVQYQALATTSGRSSYVSEYFWPPPPKQITADGQE
ncbi:unnamed protein product [Ranitomeya imitator]|uniref:Phorbol-ester/DAG-type domain-containing protein n=1 Tax=Ranitomeya imitator TaxID=111125 RepID=A0ABN9MJD0_9NEOB|nr:unnamed protein product [Ranitomeya imitator]